MYFCFNNDADVTMKRFILGNSGCLNYFCFLKMFLLQKKYPRNLVLKHVQRYVKFTTSYCWSRNSFRFRGAVQE